MSATLKHLTRKALPLAVRQGIARILGRQSWLPNRGWWVLELLRDQAAQDPNAFHRFLWTHHLAYAESYEIHRRFGAANLHPSRRLLFDELTRVAADQGFSLATDVDSVFEVGCSLGYLLRHFETDLCPRAQVLEGNDIDLHAVAQGNAYLAELDSRVKLHAADLSALSRVFAGRRFDLVLCAGVLMYLREEDAQPVVTDILRHTRRMAVFAGLAYPDRDNASLVSPAIRERDGTFIHNLDRLVVNAGGRVVERRWEGDRTVDGNTIYFVFAEPALS